MDRFEDLLVRLDQSDAESDWEEQYAGAAVPVTRDQAYSVFTSERAYAAWFGFRFDAGPPGEQLPLGEDALKAVLEGTGTPLDAYRVVLARAPLPEGTTPKHIFILLSCATGSALRGGLSWFGTWLAARTGLAAIALGEPERAFVSLALSNADELHPNLEILSAFAPLRDSPALCSPWVRATICNLWPGLSVQLVPGLPFPTTPLTHENLVQTLDEISGVGATEVFGLVKSFARTQHDTHPFVQELRARIEQGNLTAPKTTEPPPWLSEWARTQAWFGQWQLARLAGLAMEQSKGDSELAAGLVLNAAQASDLELLGNITGLAPLLTELKAAREELPEELADALVVVAFPNHVANHVAYQIAGNSAADLLVDQFQVVQNLSVTPGGFVETIVERLLRPRHDELKAASDALSKMRSSAQNGTARLSSASVGITRSAIERCAATVVVAEDPILVFLGLTERPVEIEPLETLVIALALRRLLDGVAHQREQTRLALVVADALAQMEPTPWLQRMQIEMLDEVIENAPDTVPMAEHFYQRGLLRLGLDLADSETEVQAETDLKRALVLSKTEKNYVIQVRAATTLAAFAAQNASGDPNVLRLAEQQLEEAAALPLDARYRAELLQAEAHLKTSTDAEGSLALIDEAFGLVEPGSPQWMTLTTDAMAALLKMDRVDDAVQCGADALEHADVPDVLLGTVHLWYGQALTQAKEPEDARAALTTGLRLLRGKDAAGEMLGRVFFAHLGLQIGDDEMLSEHMRFLDEHEYELNASVRENFASLKLQIADSKNDIPTQRTMLEDKLSAASKKRGSKKRGSKKRGSKKRRMKSTSLSKPRSDTARARHCFNEGVAMMAPATGLGATERIAEARRLLSEAVRIGRKRKMPELVSFLTSHGNAWKTRPNADIQKALACYAKAQKLDPPADAQAQLWKVKADALFQRGDAADLRQADKLLAKSCSIRRGRFLAETLFSRAEVALVFPNRPELEREQNAANYAMDAVRADRTFGGQEGPLRFLLQHLAAWTRCAPKDATPARYREELREIYPSLSEQIDAPIPHFDEREVEALWTLFQHPASRAFIEVRVHLTSEAEKSIGLAYLNLTNDMLGEGKPSLIGKPKELEVLLGSLEHAPQDSAYPGVLAARMLLLAHLVRGGRRGVEEVSVAMNAAKPAIDDVDENDARVFLLRELAAVWAPNDYLSDSVRDFQQAAKLLRECVELEGGTERASFDTLALLGRALRYSPQDTQQKLHEAEHLFGRCLERARVSESPDQVARLLLNLWEVENQRSTGSRIIYLKAGIDRLEEAEALVQSPQLRAQILGNLAWQWTQLGLKDRSEAPQHLRKALATFQRIDLSSSDKHEKLFFRGNRGVCEAALAKLEGGRDALVCCHREQLTELADTPLAATAKHNLARTLVVDGSAEEIAEGLRLFAESLEVRTIEANPRHHWETTLAMGASILGLLATGRAERLPMGARDAWNESRGWLRQAAKAARLLGQGEELLDAAFALCRLSLLHWSTEEAARTAEEAWADVREASGFLLLDAHSREREAWAAMQVAGRLMPDPDSSTSALAVVPDEPAAKGIARWLIRSQQPLRRAARARLACPRGLSSKQWESWRAVLAAGDQRALASELEKIRADVPGFLAEEEASESTWRWLVNHRGSVAVALWHGCPHSLALVMRVDEHEERRTQVVGVNLSDPPVPLEELATMTRGAVPDVDTSAKLRALADWLREGLAIPLETLLGAPPRSVLWSPGPRLRFVPPAAIWRVPVAVTTSFVLPEHSSPSRRATTLIALADPGPNSPEADLRGQGIVALDALAKSAAALGPVTLLASVGSNYGKNLLGERSRVRDTPASVTDILTEAAEHKVVVFVAHGHAESSDVASFSCVAASGEIEQLGVAQLADSPDAFAGAVVILLSCESGRVGDSLANPGGLAGTLLSAGAACVVAPLWPVRLDAAVQVGQAILTGLASGQEPWEALAEVFAVETPLSPVLGGPPPSLSKRKVMGAFQRHAFVAWVG